MAGILKAKHIFDSDITESKLNQSLQDKINVTYDLSNYVTTAQVQTALANKADLVNGVIPSSQMPTRRKVLHTTGLTFANNMAQTLSTTITANSTQTNARIETSLLFRADSFTQEYGDIDFNVINTSVKCEFLLGTTVIATQYSSLPRTGDNVTFRFITYNNITTGQVLSVRLTATIRGGTCALIASTTDNYIAIS